LKLYPWLWRTKTESACKDAWGMCKKI